MERFGKYGLVKVNGSKVELFYMTAGRKAKGANHWMKPPQERKITRTVKNGKIKLDGKEYAIKTLADAVQEVQSMNQNSSSPKLG